MIDISLQRIGLLISSFLFSSAYLPYFLLFGRSFGMLLAFFYCVFYPLVLVFFRIPYIIFRSGSWVLGFSLASTLFTFFRTFRYNLVVSSAYLISGAVILASDNPPFLWTAGGIILILVIVVYAHRVILLIRPVSLFDMYKRGLSSIRIKFLQTFRPNEGMANLPVASFTETQLATWMNSMAFHVIFNRVCLLVARKLNEYHRSGVAAIASVFVILGLFVFTASSFTLVNFGLFKLSPNSFATTTIAPTLFDFVYYSFNALVFSSIGKISPITALAQSIGMVETFCSLFLISVFIALMFSFGSQRYSYDLENLIRAFEDESSLTEKFIRDEFKISNVDEAIRELERLRYGFVKLIFYLSRNITETPTVYRG